MAPPDITVELREESKAESEPYHNVPGELLERISHEIFKNDCLDRRLKRHHITGTSSPENNHGWLTRHRHCVLRGCRHRPVSEFRANHCDG